MTYHITISGDLYIAKRYYEGSELLGWHCGRFSCPDKFIPINNTFGVFNDREAAIYSSILEMQDAEGQAKLESLHP